MIAFHADDDPEVWFQQNAACDHRYDRIYSPSRAGVERRLALSRAGDCRAQVAYLPWGYNPALFHPGSGAAAPAGKRYDVVFAGANMSQRNNPEHYVREGWDRQQTLVELDAICQRQGIDFALFGHGWDHHPTLHRRHRGFPEQDELVSIYHQARIVVNTGFSADGEGRPQTKLRHFEVAGCGAFQLVNDNPELRAPPLCNLLVRPHQAAAALRAYRSSDLDALRALDPLPTGRLVNDVILTTSADASFLTEAAYLQPLRELLALLARTGETLLIYGAQGEMVDQITPVLAEATAVRLLGFADRRLAGKTLRHWPIVGPEAIEHLQPGIILIAAETSGPAIYRDLSAHQGRATLVPLYDLAAPVWSVLLA
ncbi:glycosyltransferase family protein [Thiorhodovibrio litoralis]|uniref:glycosyltransferase family protein n=1 Tax=Thiorhodovibrio litoralis TaxID=2952932 RepID=UPI002B256F40|nr:hypothetical protein [Thiorhodovibrio litoralis]WPL14140.1 hypothetical protein Thiosp_03973 [Thiorhodovibrio litoralis]